ncbi:MAG: hypothetical protein QM742_08400 [Aquabacterium sp.]
MDQRTQEPGLKGIELCRFGSVLLVQPGDRIGVSVDISRAAVPPSPGSVHDSAPAGVLYIEVDDPGDASTMARVRAALGLDP